jgi:hypothetical protein
LPVRGWLYDWFYPMRFFRHAAMFRYYYIFALAVLALLASRDLAAAFHRPDDRIWPRFPIVAALTGTIAAGAFFAVTAAVPNPDGHPTGAYVHAGIGWVGLCTLAAALFMRSRLSLRAAGVLLPLLAVSDALMTANLSKDTIMNTGGHRLALPPERWRSLDRRHDPRLELTDEGWLRGESSCLDPSCQYLGNDQMITKKAVFNAYSPQINLFHLEMVQHERLRQMAVGQDRVWFAQRAQRVAPTSQNFAAFRERTEAVGTAPLLVHSRDAMLGGAESTNADDRRSEVTRIEQLPPAQPVEADVVRYEPAELIFRVRSPSDGWLLVTDRWARGWHAEINGRPAAVFGGNFIFRAVEVPAGPSEIRFWYRSSAFPWLLIVSWSTLAAIALYAARIQIRRWKWMGGLYGEA